MNGKRLLLPLLMLLMLSACGPIIGQAMKSKEGVKNFSVTEGSLADLVPGSALLVYGPFEKSAGAYYIAKGEDAFDFSEKFQQNGFFRTELSIEHTYKKLQQTADRLRNKTPQQLKEELSLDILPATILFGTITHRETVIAPSRGLVMEVGFRLEFFDVASKKTTVVEVSVRDLAQNCIPSIVKEIVGKSGRKA